MQKARQHAHEDSPSAADGFSGVTLLLWAAEADSAPQHDNIVLWQGAAREAGVRSITEYIDIHAEEVRRRYLAWSCDFGETQVFGRRLSERFKLADGTSFWWHSVFVEQSSWKQRSLETMLKLLAFDLLIERERPAQLNFAGSDRDVNLVLRAICRRRGIRFTWTRLPRRRIFTARTVVRTLPRLVHGLIALAYFVSIRLALRRRRRPSPVPSAGRI